MVRTTQRSRTIQERINLNLINGPHQRCNNQANVGTRLTQQPQAQIYQEWDGKNHYSRVPLLKTGNQTLKGKASRHVTVTFS